MIGSSASLKKRPLDERRSLVREPPLAVDRLERPPPLAPADLQVLGAERGGKVDDAGPVLERDEVRRHHPMRALDVRIERLVPSSDQRGSVELPTNGTCIGEDVLETILREDVPLALLLDHDVRGLWGNRQPRVGDQGPGCGRPPEQVRPDESIVLGLHDRELDEDARVLDVRVAHRDLGVGQRRPASRTVGGDAIVLEQEPHSVQLLERPPHALDVLRVHRPVRVVGVDPEPESLGLPLELTDVAPDGFPTQAVELGDPERLDVALALGADLLLDLELDREPVAVPARLARDIVARHRPEPWVHVLERPGLGVVDRGLSVRGRRPLVEGPQRAIPPLFELAVEHVGLAPEPEHPPLELGEVRLRVHRLEHLNLPHAKRLVPLVQGRGANPAVPPRVAGTLTVPATRGLRNSPPLSRADPAASTAGARLAPGSGGGSRRMFGGPSPPGSHLPRLARARDPSYSFPSSPVTRDATRGDGAGHGAGGTEVEPDVGRGRRSWDPGPGPGRPRARPGHRGGSASAGRGAPRARVGGQPAAWQALPDQGVRGRGSRSAGGRDAPSRNRGRLIAALSRRC